MTKKDRIEKFVKANIHLIGKPREIATRLGINYNTTRGALSKLRLIIPRRRKDKAEITQREIEPIEPIIEDAIFTRKIVKTESKQGLNLFALTYEANEKDRFTWLVKKLEKEFDIDINNRTILGYDDTQTTTDPPVIFPDFQVGRE